MASKKYNSLIAIVIIFMLLTLSCDENSSLPIVKQQTNAQQSKTVLQGARIGTYSFNGTEGDPIVLDSATQWIMNHGARNQGVIAHFFGHQIVERILAHGDCMGIRFYYAVDDSGNPNLVAMGADGKGNDFSSTFEMKGVLSAIDFEAKPMAAAFTGAEGDSVSDDISKHRISNYNSSSPAAIQAHFFGYEIIRQILSENGCVGIRCYYALNGSGVKQLLLVGVTSSGENLLPTSSKGGRVEDGNTIADASFPCPTYCSGT